MTLPEQLQAEVDIVADEIGIILTEENRNLLLVAICRGSELTLSWLEEVNKQLAQKYSNKL